MTAQILAFPNRCSTPPPKTGYQIQFERVAELLCRRSGCSIEKARAALTQAIIAT